MTTAGGGAMPHSRYTTCAQLFVGVLTSLCHSNGHHVCSKQLLHLIYLHYATGSPSTHPDRHFVHTVLNHAVNGAPLGYTGPHRWRIYINWPSAYKHRDVVEAIIDRDIERGRKLGPYSYPPICEFRVIAHGRI